MKKFALTVIAACAMSSAIAQGLNMPIIQKKNLFNWDWWKMER